VRILKKIQSAARRRANFFVGRNSIGLDDQSNLADMKTTVIKKKKKDQFFFLTNKTLEPHLGLIILIKILY